MPFRNSERRGRLHTDGTSCEDPSSRHSFSVTISPLRNRRSDKPLGLSRPRSRSATARS